MRCPFGSAAAPKVEDWCAETSRPPWWQKSVLGAIEDPGPWDVGVGGDVSQSWAGSNLPSTRTVVSRFNKGVVVVLACCAVLTPPSCCRRSVRKAEVVGGAVRTRAAPRGAPAPALCGRCSPRRRGPAWDARRLLVPLLCSARLREEWKQFLAACPPGLDKERGSSSSGVQRRPALPAVWGSVGGTARSSSRGFCKARWLLGKNKQFSRKPPSFLGLQREAGTAPSVRFLPPCDLSEP